MNIKRYAGSQGQTPRELLRYAYKRIHNKDIEEFELRLDLLKLDRDETYEPPYLELWLRRRKVNGYGAVKSIKEIRQCT